jgi:hypothetical protein
MNVGREMIPCKYCGQPVLWAVFLDDSGARRSVPLDPLVPLFKVTSVTDYLKGPHGGGKTVNVKRVIHDPPGGFRWWEGRFLISHLRTCTAMPENERKLGQVRGLQEGLGLHEEGGEDEEQATPPVSGGSEPQAPGPAGR